MLKFGWSVTVSQLVMYFGNNSDKFLLGRYWGAQELGTYGRAMQLISLPSESLAQALGGVAFPALSRVQSDPQQFRRFFLKGYALILSTTIPVTIACGIFAADIVLVMLGEKWRDAIAIFQAASPAILIFGITRPFNWMLLAKGETRRNLQVALVQVPLMIAAIVAGLPGGGVGVAEMYSYMMLLWAIPNLLWVIRGTAITAGDLLAVIGKPLLASVLAGAAAHASIDSIDTLLENLMANPFLAEELVALLHGRSPYALARLILECSVHFGLYYLILMYALGEIAFYRDLLRTMFRRSSA